MSVILVATHAAAASLSLTLGGYQLLRRPKGDRVHKAVGRMWVAAMYVMLVTSMFIRQLNPGHFSLFHALTILTFITLTAGLVAAVRGNIARHRGYLRGSYLGVVGAFVGAVAVPQRDIPQLAMNRPAVFVLAVAAIAVASTAIVLAARRSSDRSTPGHVRLDALRRAAVGDR